MNAADGDVFGSLAKVEFELFEQKLEEVKSGVLVAAGGHEKLVIKLCSYLSALRAGDEYLAVTVPEFWRSDNLGVRGRYLSMNMQIVRKGARIRRVFLLTEDDIQDRKTCDVIAAHLELKRGIDELRNKEAGFWDPLIYVIELSPTPNAGMRSIVAITRASGYAKTRSFRSDPFTRIMVRLRVSFFRGFVQTRRDLRKSGSTPSSRRRFRLRTGQPRPVLVPDRRARGFAERTARAPQRPVARAVPF